MQSITQTTNKNICKEPHTYLWHLGLLSMALTIFSLRDTIFSLALRKFSLSVTIAICVSFYRKV